MHFLVLSVLACLATAAPTYDSSDKTAAILRDDRVREDDGRYNFEVETANGIKISQSGSPEGDAGAVTKSGHFSYISPEGIEVKLKFVANENGFQPESDLLPVAPEFPHPIPQFVLDQIAFAEQQRADARARGELLSYEKLHVLLRAPVVKRRARYNDDDGEEDEEAVGGYLEAWHTDDDDVRAGDVMSTGAGRCPELLTTKKQTGNRAGFYT
ncbi:hypothetical protein Pmani_003006 [Petrolisthes manimaculis]|uniref:Uncharacterized protein n=1 Tax=Petrolisthes manimaculis TaxID=1843537 RepID=A0AAE1UPV6_9EUCA|nr:hypothetical protein Pmani_003006 [Petrolisthes manimaculis]